jgi:hypothetical protein
MGMNTQKYIILHTEYLTSVPFKRSGNACQEHAEDCGFKFRNWFTPFWNPGQNWYVLICSGMFWYVLVCNGLCLYVLACTVTL